MEKLIGNEYNIMQRQIMSIQVNLLNECTSKCKSCRKYTWPKDILDIDKLKTAIAILESHFGLQSIVFSGGDPILYPNLKELMGFCKALGISFSFITTLIHDDTELIDSIARLADRIHVSLDSVNVDSYRKIRGVNALELVKYNIELIQGIRELEGLQPIRISSTISKLNYNEAYEIGTYALNNNCDINYYLVHTWDDLIMSEQELQLLVLGLHTLQDDIILRNKGIKTNIDSMIANINSMIEGMGIEDNYFTANCIIPHIHALINANGDIYPCCKLLDDNGEYGHQLKYSYGNINKHNWIDVYNEFTKRLTKRYPLDCNLCKECSERYKPINRYIDNMKNKKPLFL